MIGLMDFLGDWRLERTIDDRRARSVGRLEGTAAFRPGGGGLIHRETGVLHLPGQAPLTATRRYLWTETPDGISVRFGDGRPFHDWSPGGDREARHDCAPDLYRVRYDLSDWPAWTSVWRVTGPRKDYVMTSRYLRG